MKFVNPFENAPADGVTRLIFVRHAQTDANAKHYLQGQSDGVLNETGLAQAASIAEHLRNFLYRQGLLKQPETRRSYGYAYC